MHSFPSASPEALSQPQWLFMAKLPKSLSHVTVFSLGFPINLENTTLFAQLFRSETE